MLILLVSFFNDTATTEIYTLSLHDALPILHRAVAHSWRPDGAVLVGDHLDLDVPATLDQPLHEDHRVPDRKSTRLNSSHANLVCRLLLEKKKELTHPSLRHHQVQLQYAAVT